MEISIMPYMFIEKIINIVNTVNVI